MHWPQHAPRIPCSPPDLCSRPIGQRASPSPSWAQPRKAPSQLPHLVVAAAVLLDVAACACNLRVEGGAKARSADFVAAGSTVHTGPKRLSSRWVPSSWPDPQVRGTL